MKIQFFLLCVALLMNSIMPVHANQTQKPPQLTEDQKKYWSDITQNILCSFIRAQRQFGLAKFYGSFESKIVYNRVVGVLQKSHYEKLAFYFNQFEGKIAMAPSTAELDVFTDYIQLQISAFKEAGIGEQDIEKQNFESIDAIKSVSVKVNNNAVASLGYDPNLNTPYFKVTHPFNGKDSVSLDIANIKDPIAKARVVKIAQDMMGLPLVINDKGTFVQLSPLPYLYPISSIEQAAGKPGDIGYTPAMQACEQRAAR